MILEQSLVAVAGSPDGILKINGHETVVTVRDVETLYRTCQTYLEFKGVLPKDAGATIENKDPWKHRSCGMKCRTCMWFVLKELTKFQGRDIDDEGQIAMKNGLGRCRRHAPTMNGYPVCYEDDWCGDHKVDENKVQP